jgi:hypothetical protein
MSPCRNNRLFFPYVSNSNVGVAIFARIAIVLGNQRVFRELSWDFS